MGENPVTIGSGEEGFDDGDFKKATFNRPQGMYLNGETLYVADTENHAIRAVDLKEGNGDHDRRHRQPGARGLSARLIRARQDHPALQPVGS